MSEEQASDPIPPVGTPVEAFAGAQADSQPSDSPPADAPATDLGETALAESIDAAAAPAAEAMDAGGALEADGLDAASLDQASIDELLQAANFEDPSQVNEYAAPIENVAMPEVEQLKLPNFQQVMQDAAVSSVDFLRDVDLNVKIELGRSRMLVEDVLKLGEGSVVELDKLAGDPVDVLVNDRLVARGEVLVLNDNFCVRINEIVAGVKEEGL